MGHRLQHRDTRSLHKCAALCRLDIQQDEGPKNLSSLLNLVAEKYPTSKVAADFQVVNMEIKDLN